MAKPQVSNLRLAVVCACLALGMGGVAFGSVPAYRLFCQVTGYEGTPRRVDAVESLSPVKQSRPLTVRFDASLGEGMPWSFVPVQRDISVVLGEQTLIAYQAVNQSEQTVTGTATFNVTPLKAGAYVAKVACFCFEQQTLAPHQRVDMPVSFYIDPAFADDPAMQDVSAITLSYTFFVAR